MSRERLAAAYEELAALHTQVAEQYAQVAHELLGTEPSAARADVAAAVPSGEPDRAAGAIPRPPSRTESAFTECPAHRKPWTDGKFGAYCTSTSDDPEWSNDKGYCRVTPRSAGAWLRQHPRVAA